MFRGARLDDRIHTTRTMPIPEVPVPVRVSRLAALWTLTYAIYRGYYAAGGTVGTLGTPVSQGRFLSINLVAAVMLLLTSLIALAIPLVWRRRIVRLVLLGFAWVATVGCVMHALIGIPQRILSLTGHLTIAYPFWETIDRRRADLQALFLNEPWFFVEGVLWAAIAWTGGMRESPRRSLWVASLVVAIVALTSVGLLSAIGVIGRWIAW
jgi:hypothetical protein